MSAAAWLYDRRGQTEQGTHGSVRGSAWRWTQTNASSDLESLRIGSTDPELVCRHPHLGAAPPPGPRQGPRAGHGDPLELLLSFGLSPAPVVSNCPTHSCLSGRVRNWTPDVDVPSGHRPFPRPPLVASIRCRGGRGAMLGLVSRATGVRAMAVSDVAPAASAATGTLAPRVATKRFGVI